MKKKDLIWEIVGYISLFGCIVGQITIGYWYLFAQFVYLFCNISMTIRCFSIHQPPADKVKNITFTAITLGLIVLKLIGI